MFWFMLVALVAVVAATALIALGAGSGLTDAPAERLEPALPQDRPVHRADLEGLRLPVVFRGYRMLDVEDTLDRLGAELADRDARIAELEAQLAGARAVAVVRPSSAEGAEQPGEDARGDFDHPARPGWPGYLEHPGQ